MWLCLEDVRYACHISFLIWTNGLETCYEYVFRILISAQPSKYMLF